MHKTDSEREARNRILSVALEHFASRGYHGSSIRDITRQAGANLASINYHFRSKESLYREVLSSVLRPLNRLRLQRLDRAAELSGDQPVPLELVVEIFAGPLFEICVNSSSANAFAARIIGRSMTEPLPFIQDFLAVEQQPFTSRFSQAIRLHARKMDASEFMWRLSFVVGALHHTLATMHCIQNLTQGLCKNNDVERTTAHFVQFAVNTIKAPVFRNDG